MLACLKRLLGKLIGRMLSAHDLDDNIDLRIVNNIGILLCKQVPMWQFRKITDIQYPFNRKLLLLSLMFFIVVAYYLVNAGTNRSISQNSYIYHVVPLQISFLKFVTAAPAGANLLARHFVYNVFWSIFNSIILHHYDLATNPALRIPSRLRIFSSRVSMSVLRFPV